MNDRIFVPADILLPRVSDMTRWSVIACDQFTSEPVYWQAIEAMVGEEPSTLRLILPEAWLDRPESAQANEKIRAAMQKYLDEGLFRTLNNAFIYTERTQSDGRVRRGLVGALDLEAYDFRDGSCSPVRATEGTVESRLPPRVRVRASAPLELPHVMVLIDDPDRRVIEPLAGFVSMEKLYDFGLMMGGGSIKGHLVAGEALHRTEEALGGLAAPEALARKYGDPGAPPLLFAMGDGNHSLAAAKLWWEQLKKTLTAEERENHPARFGLVELVNIHDEAIDFQPIHRVMFETDAAAFAEAAADFWEALRGAGHGGGSHTLTVAAGESRRSFHLEGLTIGQLVAAADELCEAFIKRHGGRIDYVHGDETAGQLSAQPGCCAVLLPAMEKSELFSSVLRSGVFPRKSFSIGNARDKRYYLECRKIR